MTLAEQLSQRRPKRADAARNFDELLGAARAAFDELGGAVPLEDIARRAKVGIATLYRNFPTREDLIDGVYAEEVDEVCLAAQSPDISLDDWLEQLVARLGSRRALVEGLRTASTSRAALWAAGETLLDRAIAAGVVNERVEIDDLMRLVIGIIAMHFDDPAQRERVLGMMLEGIRAR